jgi:hypothetical protein
MITSASYPLTGHILYVKTIAGTMVATIKVGESRILVMLDTENPDAPFASREEVGLRVESGQVHIQRRGETGPSIIGGLVWIS